MVENIICGGAFMVFEKIKTHFMNKKQQKDEKNWYTIEFRFDKTMHIVDQKMLEIILADRRNSLDELISCGWTKNLGWHEGEDGKIYERHALNEAGLDYYERLKTHCNIAQTGPLYVKLLNDMNNYKYPTKADITATYMYFNICENFKRNEIKSIKKYDKKELTKEQENVAVLN